MRIAVVGAGATGGFLGAHLARAGEDVVLIARGAHLAAMRERGLTVRGGEQEFTAHPECTDDIGAVAGADFVFLTVKSHAIAGLAPALAVALDPEATIVGAQNGIPWWYFRDRHLESVDPEGFISRHLPYDRVLGCIVYPATTVVEPGLIVHLEGDRFSLGEPDGARTERLVAIAGALTRAGLRAPITGRIRSEIWLKLLGNATLNPVSALTGATLADIVASPATRQLVRTLMAEVLAVATAVGVKVEIGIEKRLQGVAQVGAHRTSMLQDLEAGRPLEIDALLGAVVELALAGGVEVPALQALLALTRLLDSTRRRA